MNYQRMYSLPSKKPKKLAVLYILFSGIIFVTSTKAQEISNTDEVIVQQQTQADMLVLDGDGVLETGEMRDEAFFSQLLEEQQQDIIDRAFPLLAAKWEFNNIFVCWETLDEKYFDARTLVKDAIAGSWASVSGLDFLGWGPCTKQSQGIRIAIRDVGPHVKVMGKFVDGIEDGMVLNFDYESWGQGCRDKTDYCNKVIAIHEFGHAIGFAHEQNRPDTPGECDKQQGSDGDTISLTPWDPDSVMNYCNPVYANNGELSEFDVIAVQHIYGKNLNVSN